MNNQDISQGVISALNQRIHLADYVINNASSMMIDLFHKHLQQSEKTPNDFVTELDQAIESMALKSVLQSFPDDGFYGEEGAGTSTKNGYLWIIDPIDGTNNFVRGLPLCGVQLAILFEDKPIFSVIMRPFTQEIFTAQKGRGAHYKNLLTGESSELHVSNRRLSESMAIFDAQIGKSANPATKLLHGLADHVAAIRVFGVAVFDIPSVAAGVAEILVTGIAQPYDVAPGMLLLTEAGGEVYSSRDGDVGIRDKLMIFSNKAVKEELLTVISEHRGKHE